MKSKIKYIRILLILFAMTAFNSCQEDFLERYPLDRMTDATFFTSANDVKVMVNGFYRLFPRYHFQSYGSGANDQYLDANTDILIGINPSGSLMQQGSSGQAPASDGTWNSSFSWIRQINYLIENADRVPASAEADQYIGEAYFFRAWVYFNMLVRYGDVPIYTEVLDTDSEALYRKRDSRYDVAMFILEDLDNAIAKMGWKNSNFSQQGRVNKESALTMKARVALFEGAWERYHGANNTPFAVEGKDGNDFLQMVEPAVQQLIDHPEIALFTQGGPLNEAYNQLNSQEDASTTAGVFLYRMYDNTEIVGHNFFDRVVSSTQSVTMKFVRDYLDKEGRPQEISILLLDDKNLTNLAENLDPRFRQSVWTPDRGPQDQLPGLEEQALPSRYPILNGTFDALNHQPTGLRRWKGAILNANQWRDGSTDDVLMRYAEGLLALAEAKAILGTITQSDLDKTVNILRDRVGMAPMNLADVQSWSISYSLQEGFDPSESNIVNEIRRERAVELVFEGHRARDLRRWAVFHSVINGWKPKGAHSQEFLDYFNNPDTLIADGFTAVDAGNYALTEGVDYDVFSDGFLNPFYKTPEFQTDGDGYYVVPDRVYLAPIPKNEIDLYMEDAGVELEQNPGWF